VERCDELPQQQVPDRIILDLREIPLDQLVQRDDTVLSHCLSLYYQRLKDDGEQFNAFNNVMAKRLAQD
jgi:hypothetical protein